MCPPEDEADETEIGYVPRPPTEPPKPVQRCPCLVAVGGALAGRVFALSEPETHAGRAPGAAIRLSDTGVSRIHARFTVAAEGVELQSLGRKGTLVNGASVQRCKLSDGDRIEIGDATVLLFTYFEATKDAIEANLLFGTSRDVLTGAWTKRRLIAELERELAFSKRHGGSPALLVASSSWPGHTHEPASISRAVVAEIGERIHSCIGQTEPFARWSETAFVILVRDADEAAVSELVVRIAQSVTKAPVATDLGARNVSLQVVPIRPQGQASVQSIVNQADAATQSHQP